MALTDQNSFEWREPTKREIWNARKAGARAFRRSSSVESNPYRMGDDLWLWWRDGYRSESFPEVEESADGTFAFSVESFDAAMVRGMFAKKGGA